MKRLTYLLFGLALALMPAAAQNDDDDCLICHSNPSFAERDARGNIRSLFVDPQAYWNSTHGDSGCSSCHGNFGAGPHTPPNLAPLNDAWAAILAERPPAAQVAVAACMSCHQTEAAAYATSIHAQAAAAGNPDTPLCHDCHGYHAMRPNADLESETNPANVPATCAKCHADATKMVQYNVDTRVVETFETSFHGEKGMLGDADAAICSSCHGTHDILSKEDPASRINPNNVAETCGECHKGAGEQFAKSFQHTVPSLQTAPLVFWVSTLYNVMIYISIGMMILYVILDFLRRRRNGGHG